MSAINPASFASPTLGLQAPSGVGPGAVVNRGSAARRQEAQQDTQSNYSGSTQASRGAQSTFQAGSTYPGLNYPYSPYGAFGNAARAGGMPYTPGAMQGLDSFAGGFQQGGDYTSRGRFPSPQSPAIAQHDQAVPALGAQSELFPSFQSLSLNSR